MSAVRDVCAVTPVFSESAHVFDCEGESLCAVLSRPACVAGNVGVLIVVGGPQYRVGSHRQFALLARALAAAGYPVLRFDVRGMGDSSGEFPGFESLGPDIRAAVAGFQTQAPSVRRIVLWGLCDGASASMMYAAEGGHAGAAELAGLVLLNPWVRHEVTFARAQVKAYYGQRLLESAFWRKLLKGDVQVGRGLRELGSKLWAMRPGAPTGLPAAALARGPVDTQAARQPEFRERMVAGLTGFQGAVLFVLSGRDHTCAEFLEFTRLHPRLRGLWAQARVSRVDMADADHTFSNAQARDAVAETCRHWLDSLASGARS